MDWNKLIYPAWVTYEPAAKIADANVVRVPTNSSSGFQPNLDAIKSVVDENVKIVVLNSPCNPTGAVFPKETVRAINAFSKSHAMTGWQKKY